MRVDVLNLLDSDDDDITYFYASRLAGEPAEGVEDLHFHPIEPRTVRAPRDLEVLAGPEPAAQQARCRARERGYYEINGARVARTSRPCRRSTRARNRRPSLSA